MFSFHLSRTIAFLSLLISLFSLVLFLGTKSYCQRVKVLRLHAEEDRREFVLTRVFPEKVDYHSLFEI